MVEKIVLSNEWIGVNGQRLVVAIGTDETLSLITVEEAKNCPEILPYEIVAAADQANIGPEKSTANKADCPAEETVEQYQTSMYEAFMRRKMRESGRTWEYYPPPEIF